ncbi:MAG: hypothetical protein HW398_260, partial [Acidobacteria bacterium]|nr:hypothetical protein [Acidobacteriota bacterium]
MAHPSRDRQGAVAKRVVAAVPLGGMPW